MTRANEFLTRAKSVYEGFVSYQENLDSIVVGMVEDINYIGDRIRQLNEDIVSIESGRIEKANDLRDERNLLLDQLGQYGKIEYHEDIFGNVICLFEGSSFITTDHVNHIACDNSLSEEKGGSPAGYNTPYWEYAAVTELKSDGSRLVISIDGAYVFDLETPISTSIDTDIGKLKSVLLARGDRNANYHDIVEDKDYYNEKIAQSVIMNVEAEFDQMIHNIMAKMNEILESAESNPGVLDDSKGMPSDFTLFTVANEDDKLVYRVGEDNPPGTVITGLTIKNTQINPLLIQDPTSFTFRTIDGSEDTATMTALKEAFTKEEYVLNPNVSTRNSFITYYNSLVSQVANSADVYNSIKEAQEKTVSAVSSAREQIVGVSSDEELEFMIMFQNAYNASSRYINVVSEMLEHLVSTLGA